MMMMMMMIHTLIDYPPLSHIRTILPPVYSKGTTIQMVNVWEMEFEDCDFGR